MHINHIFKEFLNKEEQRIMIVGVKRGIMRGFFLKMITVAYFMLMEITQ